MSCIICYDDTQNIKCEISNNLICGDCIYMHLKSKTSVEEINFAFSKKLTSIFCFCNNNCTNLIGLHQIPASFDENILIKIHEEWIRCNKTIIENNIIKEQEEIIAKKIEEERKRKESDIFLYEVQEKTKEIINNILTPKCPHCKQAFDNFSGCFSLKCSRCKYTFCAWCLDFYTIEKPIEEEGGYECHNHVSNCRYNIHKGDYFGTIEEFDENMSMRIAEQLNNLIENSPNKEAFYLSVFNNLSVQLESYNLILNDYGFIVSKKKKNQQNRNDIVNPPVQRPVIDVLPQPIQQNRNDRGLNWINVNGHWVNPPRPVDNQQARPNQQQPRFYIHGLHPPILPRQQPPLLPNPFPVPRVENPPRRVLKKRRCSYCKELGHHDKRNCPIKMQDLKK